MWNLNALTAFPLLPTPPHSLSFSWFYPCSNCHLRPLHSTPCSKCQVLVQFPLKICDHPPNSLKIMLKIEGSYGKRNRGARREGRAGVKLLIFNRKHTTNLQNNFQHTHREREEETTAVPATCGSSPALLDALCHMGYALLSCELLKNSSLHL